MEELINLIYSHPLIVSIIMGLFVMFAYITSDLHDKYHKAIKTIKNLEFQKEKLYEEQQELKKDNVFLRNLIEIRLVDKKKPEA